MLIGTSKIEAREEDAVWGQLFLRYEICGHLHSVGKPASKRTVTGALDGLIVDAIGVHKVAWTISTGPWRLGGPHRLIGRGLLASSSFALAISSGEHSPIPAINGFFLLAAFGQRLRYSAQGAT